MRGERRDGPRLCPGARHKVAALERGDAAGMKRIVVCVAAALVVTAGQAAAEGLPPTSRIRAPGTVVGPNWNGFYIGAGIGAGVVSHDLSGTETKNREVCKEWKKVKYGKYHCFVCTKYGYEQDTKSFSDSGTSDVGIFGVVAV